MARGRYWLRTYASPAGALSMMCRRPRSFGNVCDILCLLIMCAVCAIRLRYQVGRSSDPGFYIELLTAPCQVHLKKPRYWSVGQTSVGLREKRTYRSPHRRLIYSRLMAHAHLSAHISSLSYYSRLRTSATWEWGEGGRGRVSSSSEGEQTGASQAELACVRWACEG